MGVFAKAGNGESGNNSNGGSGGEGKRGSNKASNSGSGNETDPCEKDGNGTSKDPIAAARTRCYSRSNCSDYFSLHGSCLPGGMSATKETRCSAPNVPEISILK